MKLNAKQLRRLNEKNIIPPIKRLPIYFILENIYDTYNIGGLFRLADALAIQKIYLCGETETPPNSKIKKASIGTDKIVPWEYKKSTNEAINDLNSQFQILPQSGISLCETNSKQIKKSNTKRVSIVAVEQHPNSVPYHQFKYQLPIALIFGNESFGILPETLKKADSIIEIPMFGINKSLNVIVSAAIVSYHLVFQVFLNKSNQQSDREKNSAKN